MAQKQKARPQASSRQGPEFRSAQGKELPRSAAHEDQAPMARHLSPASRICSPISLGAGRDGNQLAGGVGDRGLGNALNCGSHRLLQSCGSLSFSKGPGAGSAATMLTVVICRSGAGP